MGIRPAPDKCFITGLPTKDRPTQYDTIDYSINIAGTVHNLKFDFSFEPSKFIENNHHVFIGLILKGKLNTNTELTNDIIIDILKTADYPRTPNEKMLGILKFINEVSDYEGDKVTLIELDLDNDLLANSLFLKNKNEFDFYLSSLNKKGLIKLEPPSPRTDVVYSKEVNLTIDGLNYLIDSENISKDSKRCFIAMSFHDDEKPIKEAIKQACVNTGYNPILINEININSDTTVNDAIIAELRKAKFCIADFTRQRNGVYFESGFALGLGLKVIYSCHEEWFKESHFDTNHFSHIIYDDPSDLTKSLEDKIRAWIN